MMAGNETTRRRRVHGRSPITSEASSASPRTNTATGLHQHHHHHDHHHHHYHYHHHYHHFPRSLNGDQEQGLLLSSGVVAASGESSSQADLHHNDQQGHANSRNNLQPGTFPREATNEDRGRLDERLRSSAMQSRRPGFRASLMEEFSLLFEDDDDPWSDDELLGLGIEEWLAAGGFEEALHSEAQSLPEHGLSKALIRRLPRVVFVPPVSGEDMGVSSVPTDQEDCSVCLEHFVMGQQLICLPCKHRFHPNCLTPWLESHAKCPYCRAKVSIEGAAGAAGSSQTGNGSAVSLIEDDLIAWMEAVDSGLSQLYIS